jgi:hypothetical protein
LEGIIGLTVAEMIERSGDVTVSIVLAVAIIWFIYRYIKRDFDGRLEYTKELQDKASDMRISLHVGTVFEGGLTDADGESLPSNIAFLARISNNRDKFLEKCQIVFGIKDQFHYPVCAPFDLRHGENRDFPVMRVENTGQERRAFVYFLRNSDWKIDTAGPSWILGAGIYEIKVFSANTSPASLSVQLSKTDEKWILTNLPHLPEFLEGRTPHHR